MIVDTTPAQKATMGGVQRSAEFRMTASAKSFEILSDDLYSDPVRAIIRELSCNALDSHIDAGRGDQPFEVHLPTELEPWFSVRDFGTGLDEQQVFEVFTVYFESTKTSSNDFVGALGLGSKSPFAVTDNFAVTAVKDGIKGIYTAYINDQGVPAVVKMSQENTDEPSGLEVRFGVESSSLRRRFAHSAQTVFRPFEVKPVITGHQVEVKDYQFKEQDIVAGVSVLGDIHGTIAVMGNIEYPIDRNYEHSIAGDLDWMIRHNLKLDFAIGEVEFHPSRERLKYSKKTCDAITARLESLKDHITDQLKQELDHIDNIWELADKHKNYSSKSSLHNQLVSQYFADRGINSHHTLFFIKCSDAVDNNIKLEGFRVSKSWRTTSVFNYSTSAIKDHRSYDQGSVVNSYPVTAAPGTVVVINDTKTGAIERAKYHFRNNGGASEVWVAQPIDKSVKFNEKKLLELFKYPTRVVKASDLDAKPKKARAPSDKQKYENVTVISLNVTRPGWDSSWQTAGTLDTFDKNKTHYYVPLSGYEFNSQYGATVADPKEYINRAAHVASIPGKIFGIRKADLKTVKALSNWINVEDVVVESLNKLDEKQLLLRRAAYYASCNGFVPAKIEQIQDRIAADSPMHKIRKIIEAGINQTRSIYDLQRSYKTMSRLYNIDICDIDDVDARADKLAKTIIDYYPLLSDRWYCNNEYAAEYVNLVDKHTKRPSLDEFNALL